MRNIAAQNEHPCHVTYEVEHVAYRDVEEYHLLGLSSDRSHLSQEHHRENDDADNIRFDVKKCVVQYHNAIIF